jgi:hypothetical protein
MIDGVGLVREAGRGVLLLVEGGGSLELRLKGLTHLRGRVVVGSLMVVEGGCGRVLSDGELLMNLWLDVLNGVRANSFLSMSFSLPFRVCSLNAS